MIPAWLAEEFKAGPLPFERFMAQALYHPTQGYYTRGIQNVGRDGDFSTTATLSSTLARAIAHWVREELEVHQAKPPFHLLEAGPGNGTLAREVLEALPWRIRRKVQLHLVEVSPPLRALQETALRKYSRRVHWHATVAEALAQLGQATPLIYSNELFDAFPVRIFQYHHGEIQELHLTLREERIIELWLPATDLPESTLFSSSWPEKQRFEVSPAAHAWLTEATAALTRGSILTIDYGGNREEIYHRRPHGSIRAYFQHQYLTGAALYQNVGYQDLTADVPFEELEAWGHQLGLETVQRTTQAEFLAPFLTEGAADHFLSSPEGAGSAFKVLIQRKT